MKLCNDMDDWDREFAEKVFKSAIDPQMNFEWEG